MGCKNSKTNQNKDQAAAPPKAGVIADGGEKQPQPSNEIAAAITMQVPEPNYSQEPNYLQPQNNDAASVGGHGMLRKMRTALVDSKEVDFMVLKYECHDSLLHGAKESTWVVQAGIHGKPIEIKLHVDRTLVSTPEVAVECDGFMLFPGPYSSSKKDRLREDFVQEWPFRGVAKGIGEKDVVQIQPPSMYSEQWYPGILTRQRADGLFEVLCLMPDGRGGTRQVHYPAIKPEYIRYVGTGKPFLLPQRMLRLEVPQDDPANATLSVDQHDLITHYFARPTPNPTLVKEHPTILMKVSKDRQQVTANVGHSVFAHHLNGDVRLVKQQADKYKHTWTIQIGPFAEHTIEVEKKRKSKVVSLSIDGDKFVEASAEDIDCEKNHWECKFRFVGERHLDFEVFETNRDGKELDSTAMVKHLMKFNRECVVSLWDESDLRSAELIIDNVCFRNLPMANAAHYEDNLSISPDVLKSMYRVQIPYKVNEQAALGLGMNAFVGGPRNTEDLGLFGVLCCIPRVETNDHCSYEPSRF
jgi:hypothetical protein